MFQRRNDLVLAEQSAYVCGTSAVDVKVDSLDKLYVEDLISVVSSPIYDFHCVDNVTNHDFASIHLSFMWVKKFKVVFQVM